MVDYYPFSYGYILTSIVGFLISAMYIMNISKTWGFTFALFFSMMFIASMISLSKVTADMQVRKEKAKRD